MTPLVALRGYADFIRRKPNAWRAGDWAYWALAVFTMLVWSNLMRNDPGATSGAGYLFLLVIAPAFVVFTLIRGFAALMDVLGKS